MRSIQSESDDFPLRFCHLGGCPLLAFAIFESQAARLQAPEPEPAVVDYLEVEHVEPAQEPPQAVNVLMPAPEQKNKTFLIVGIILMALAVGFLVLMIVSHGK